MYTLTVARGHGKSTVNIELFLKLSKEKRYGYHLVNDRFQAKVLKEILVLFLLFFSKIILIPRMVLFKNEDITNLKFYIGVQLIL